MFVPKAQSPGLAAALIVAASAFIAASTLMAKTLTTGVLGPALHPLQVSHGRFLFALLLIGALALRLRPRFEAVHWRLHIGRTAFGWGGVTLMFAAVGFIPMADATAITFLNPVVAMIIAIPLLGERVGPIRWSAAGLALIGAMVLLRPTPASFQPGALLALAAAVVMGMEVILIKKLTGREAPFQILVLNNVLGVCIATVAVLFVWQQPSALQWAGLVAVGGLMACAQVFFLNGMARADASYVAPFTYAVLIFAALYDFLSFGVVPDWVSVAGITIILSGGLLLALREAQLRRAP